MIFAWRLFGLPCALVQVLAGDARTPDSSAARADLARWLARSWPPITLAQPARINDSLWRLSRRFYAGRAQLPAWRLDEGRGRLDDLLDRLQRAQQQGLDSSDYGLDRLRSLAARGDDSESQGLLDLLATATWLRYASDLAYGRVIPRVVDSLWTASPRTVDLLSALATSLDSNRVGAALDDLAPPQRSALHLRAALAWYRAIAARGGWPRLPDGPPLQLDAAGPDVAVLRQRLEITGDLAPGGAGTLFDSALDVAVRRAQQRHGLEPDGIVGGATRRALNVPVQDRIRQLELSLERWRWLPRDLGPRYLMVNSAGFSLELVDSGRVVLQSRIVAGRVTWPTPIFSSRITEITFNPRWNIPRSIAVQEILPKLRRDPGYLTRSGIHVEHVSEPGTDLVCNDIPWDSVSASGFVYRMWQEPGPENPLGFIRFTIPGPFGVALHSTQAPSLFLLLVRASSHGCVRVEEAERLAAYLLRDRPGWTDDSLRAATDSLVERYVTVPDPLPVYVTYRTAWMSDGQVSFRPDLYRWDAELAAALRRRGRGLR
ncbi:MAG TPA: L,D-transpeptidase family protein [Gemmatimonadales bacterium]|nr:L,D-transpeptidase family protein [Gemmatimonadales bacterium]